MLHDAALNKLIVFRYLFVERKYKTCVLRLRLRKYCCLDWQVIFCVQVGLIMSYILYKKVFRWTKSLSAINIHFSKMEYKSLSSYHLVLNCLNIRSFWGGLGCWTKHVNKHDETLVSWPKRTKRQILDTCVWLANLCIRLHQKCLYIPVIIKYYLKTFCKTEFLLL